MIFLLLFLLFIAPVMADTRSDQAGPLFGDVNGTNAARYRSIKFTNGATTNNSDGSATIDVSGSLGGFITKNGTTTTTAIIPFALGLNSSRAIVVGGGADEVQETITGYSGQTASYFLVQDSTASPILTVNNDKSLTVAGNGSVQSTFTLGMQVNNTSQTGTKYDFDMKSNAGLTTHIDSTSGFMGIGSTIPTSMLSLNGQAQRTIQTERNTTSATAGNDFILKVGGAISGSTNKNGGDLYLSGGVATGSGTSNVLIQVAGGGGSGTSDSNPATVATFNSTTATLTDNLTINKTTPILSLTKPSFTNSNVLNLANMVLTDGSSNTMTYGLQTATYFNNGASQTGTTTLTDTDFSANLNGVAAFDFGASGVTMPSNYSITAGAYKPNTTQTTTNCATSGTIVSSQPIQGATYKEVIIYANACLGAAVYTYPTAFTNTPEVISQSLAAIAAPTTTTVTVTGTTSTGFITLNGY